MKKILVPVDFSQYSEFALMAAVKLLGEEGELVVLHMLDMADALVTKDSSEHQAKTVFFLKLAEKRFHNFLDKDYLKGVAVSPVIKQYKNFSEVNELIAVHEIDLVVMGSHGASGLKEVFVGSNTEKMVRVAEVPVMVVKNQLPDISFNGVVFACDFSKECINVYRKAMSFFKALEVSVHLLYVNLPNDKFLSTVQMDARIAGFLKEADGDLKRMGAVAYQADFTVENGIVNYANKLGLDLISLPTHGRKGISHFFNGSIGEDLANHSALPVITFKM